MTPGSVHSFELPGRERIETTARHYYEQVTARNQSRPGENLQARKQRIDHADAEAERVGRDLSRLLLAPAERLLGERPLLIVADGALQYIPFAALPLSGVPLATRHEVVSLPLGLGIGGIAPHGPRPLAGAEDARGLRRPGLPGDRRTVDSSSRSGGTAEPESQHAR